MSTRANVLIRQGRKEIWLYKHMDGYPAECGAEVLKVVQKVEKWYHANREPTAIANQFFRYIYLEGHDGPKPMYELTTEEHGDIEHLYVITILGAGQVQLGYATRKPFDEGDGTGPIRKYTLDEFKQLINEEISAMNKRIRERHPTATDLLALVE